MPEESTQKPIKTRNYGHLALVCGVVGIVIPYLGALFGIAAILLFFAQLRNGGRTIQAVVGLALGIVAVVTLPLSMYLTASYGGLFALTAILPNSCTFHDGLNSCRALHAEGNTIKFELKNNLDRDITLTQSTATISGMRAECIPQVLASGNEWKADERKNFTISGCAPQSGERAIAHVTLYYLDGSSEWPSTAQGTVSLTKGSDASN